MQDSLISHYAKHGENIFPTWYAFGICPTQVEKDLGAEAYSKYADYVQRNDLKVA